MNDVKSMQANSKPHYEILDGLRGVAAVMVLIFHIFETHSMSCGENFFVHGYLAVDFFFVLSGFVIGYAYDDRRNKMSISAFIKRRLIRLHPMVIFGMVIGAVCFYFGASDIFSLIADTPVWKMLFYMVLGMLLIPTPPSIDIRGWQEMHTLDAPVWSLFFEYIANLLYVLFIRRFSNTMLAIFVFLSACATVYISVFAYGDVVGGWRFDGKHLQIGFTRLMYPFFAGLLLFRIAKLKNVKRAFLWCSLMLIAVFAIPRLGDSEHLWMNGLYEALIIIVVFPLIVYFGASSKVNGKYASKICKFLGEISYPLYIIHYPLIYIYTGWVVDNKYSIVDTFWVALFLFVGSLSIAYAALKLYDLPVRN